MLPASRTQPAHDLALQSVLDRLTRGAIERANGPGLPDNPDGWVTALRRLPAAEARYAPFPDGIDERLRVALPVLGHGEFGHLVARVLGVPAVGEEPGRAVRRDDHLAVRTREPGQVADVRQPGDDHRVDAERRQALGQAASPQPVIHGRASSATW